MGPKEIGLNDEDIIEFKLEQSIENVQNEKITIAIKGQHGDLTYFKINKNSRLTKVFIAYTKQKSLSLDSVRFLFDGERLAEDIDSAQTAEDVNLNDKDTIDCVLAVEGGKSCVRMDDH